MEKQTFFAAEELLASAKKWEGEAGSWREKEEKEQSFPRWRAVRADAVMRSDADLLSGKIDQAIPIGLVVQQILERREVLTRVVGVNIGRVKVRSRTFDQGG